jgi:hypothetical protein
MKVVSLKENKDGSAMMTYDLEPTEVILLRAEAKRRGKRYTHKFVNEVVLQALEEGMKRDTVEKVSAPKSKKSKRKK